MNEIFKRRSCRKFIDKEVEDDKIKNILKAAFASPTAKNQRSWEFYVVKNKEKLSLLSRATPYSMCVKNAPVAIVVCYQKESIAKEFSEIDCAIATENILLAVESEDLGAVMIGVAPIEENMKKIEEILNIDKNLRAFTIIPIGYKEHEKEPNNNYFPEKVHYVE